VDDEAGGGTVGSELEGAGTGIGGVRRSSERGPVAVWWRRTRSAHSRLPGVDRGKKEEKGGRRAGGLYTPALRYRVKSRTGT
jgi:hypothetical protein